MAFAAGSMGPKVEAACRFASATGKRAAIGALADSAGSSRGRLARPSQSRRAGSYTPPDAAPLQQRRMLSRLDTSREEPDGTAWARQACCTRQADHAAVSIWQLTLPSAPRQASTASPAATGTIGPSAPDRMTSPAFRLFESANGYELAIDAWFLNILLS